MHEVVLTINKLLLREKGPIRVLIRGNKVSVECQNEKQEFVVENPENLAKKLLRSGVSLKTQEVTIE